MEYSSTIWDPHTSVNINCLESVQKYAARMCFKNYLVCWLISIFLPYKREETEQNYKCYSYKVIHQLVAIPNNYYRHPK